MIAQGILILALSAGVAAGVAGVYMQGKKAGKNEIIAQVATSQQIADAAAEKVANRAAEAISKIKVQNRTIMNEVQRELQTNVVYRDCQHSPDQLRNLNAAITGQADELAGRGLVPPANAASGSVVR